MLVLDGAVRGWVRLRVAKATHDCCTIAEQLLWAVLKLVAFLATTFTPHLSQCQVVDHYNLELLGFIGLMKDRLDHGASFLKVFVCLSCDKHIERFLVPLLLIVNPGSVLSPITSH